MLLPNETRADEIQKAISDNLLLQRSPLRGREAPWVQSFQVIAIFKEDNKNQALLDKDDNVLAAHFKFSEQVWERCREDSSAQLFMLIPC